MHAVFSLLTCAFRYCLGHTYAFTGEYKICVCVLTENSVSFGVDTRHLIIAAHRVLFIIPFRKRYLLTCEMCATSVHHTN